MKKYLPAMRNYFSVLGLVAVTAFFAITTKGAILSVDSLRSILNQVMVTALVSLGSVFVFGCGCFDVSVGGTVCIAAVLGGYVGVGTGNVWLMALTCLAVALALNVLKGLFATYAEVPLFIVTVVLNFVLASVVLVILGSKSTLYLNEAENPVVQLSGIQMTILNAVVLILYFLLCLVLFNGTGLGKQIKILGGNPATARQTGISTAKIKITAFALAAIGVALAAFILLMRTRAVGSTTAGGMGNDVMIALVLGGMPLTGGPRSRIAAGMIGSVTITLLNVGLTMMGLDQATIQICRAVVFLAVAYVASASYRTKLLPR